MTRFTDDDALLHAHDAPGLLKNKLDELRVFVVFLGKSPRPVGRFNGSQVDGLSLSLRDHFLGDD